MTPKRRALNLSVIFAIIIIIIIIVIIIIIIIIIIIMMFISYFAQSNMQLRYDRMRITTIKS